MERTFDLYDSKTTSKVTVKAEKHGNEWKAKCPRHGDTNPSLSINPEKGVYHCFGCNFEGQLWRVQEATYDYTDKEGKLLFQVVKSRRGDAKDYFARRPDGRGGWINNLEGVSLVLYRLPELIKGADPVFIVEGEKDVETLRKLDLTATTNPLGAGKWRIEYNIPLYEREVVILPDNDEAGKKHAEMVAEVLEGIAKSVKVVNLTGLPEKGDVTDWLIAGNTKEELLSLVESTPVTKAAKEIRVEDLFETQTTCASAEEGIVKGLEKVTMLVSMPEKGSMEDGVIKATDLIVQEVPQPKSILEPWITEESITLVAGWRGVGKTWFTLGIANAITMGYQKFGPWEIITAVPCLYVDGEMSLYSMQQRLKLLGHNEREKKAPLFIYSNALANAKGKPSTSLYKPEHRETITQICKREGIKVLFLDNISSLAPGEDENVKKDWDVINQWLLSLRFMGVSTLMLHHVGKQGTQRGTTGREDNVDHSIILSNPKDYSIDDGIRFRVNFTKNRVDHENIHLITETEFKGTKIDGRIYLNHEPVATKREEQILEMLSRGMKQADVAKALKVSEAYVSKVKSCISSDLFGHFCSKRVCTLMLV